MKSFETLIREMNKPPNSKIDIIKVISNQLNIPQSVVKNGIKQSLLTINNKPIHTPEIIVREGITIRFQGHKIVIKQEDLVHIDKYINIVLETLNIDSIHNIRPTDKSSFCSYLLDYFSNHQYETIEISKSKFFDVAFHELENFYKDYFKDSKDNKIPKRKELIETLIKVINEKTRELKGLIENLSSGVYDRSPYKFLQEYAKIINHVGFAQYISNILPNSLYSRPAIESLIKPIQEAQNQDGLDKKFIHFDANKGVYERYQQAVPQTTYIGKIYNALVSVLLKNFIAECQTSEQKPAKISISGTSRKYNFSNEDRVNHELFFTVGNIGEGLARSVKISVINSHFHFEPYEIALLKPEESRDISIDAKIMNLTTFEPKVEIKLEWQNLSNQSSEVTTYIDFHSQKTDIPWADLEKNKPYTIQEIEDKEKLYGRDEILKELKTNILSDKVESYKIWGQKRVGKSSIVKTLRKLFDNEEKIMVVWRSIASIKNTDPILTLNTLGESLCSEIFEELDKKIKNPSDRERLKSIEVPEFNGSLYPLENYIRELKKIDPVLKFIFILDEFDRINEEFFLPGNLGDTLSLNIGKGLNEKNYIGFILVGSENMHLLDRQGINYNTYHEIEVDTFNKNTQYESFKKIITSPVLSYIDYTEEAIEKIYDVTNGNPYFANLICLEIFKICLKLKDNEVDISSVNKSIDLIVNSSQKSHFEHFWGDGITDESNIKKEKKADIRRRILVSLSFCYFQHKKFPLRQEIIRGFKKPSEYLVENYEIDNTITEFFNRKIFYDEANLETRIKPSLFEGWLCGPGRSLMIEGVSDLEALQREKQLEEEYTLKNDELRRLSETLIFKGEKLKVSDFQAYFNQFGDPLEQRRIFKLLDAIYYISKDDINDFFRKEQKAIFNSSEIEIKTGAKKLIRDHVEIYSFPNSINENLSVVETFKILSHIRSTKTLKDIRNNKDYWKQNDINDIVIFEGLIDDFSVISDDLVTFFDDRLLREKIPVKLVTLLITSKAKTELIKCMAHIPNFKLIHFKEVGENAIKPFIETTEVFETNEEASYAFAEVRKKFNSVRKSSLNVLFESHCPSKSLPILWHETSLFKPIFPNKNAKYSDTDEDNHIAIERHLSEEQLEREGEEIRAEAYRLGTELERKMQEILLKVLKGKFGEIEKDWWVKGVPSSIRQTCSIRYEEENRQDNVYAYLDFIDYGKIAESHPELRDFFFFDQETNSWNVANKSKDKQLAWLKEINNGPRRKWAHGSKKAPSANELDHLRAVHQAFLKNCSAALAK